MDEAAIEAALHGDRRADRDQRLPVALAPGIDQRARAAVVDHELVAVGLRDATADRDDAVALGQAGDRDGAQRRHLDRRLQRMAGDGAGDAAQREQADRRRRRSAGGATAMGRDMGSFMAMSFIGCDGLFLTSRAPRALNHAVQFGFSPCA